MKWETTIIRASEMNECGDATLSAQTVISFGSNDFYSTMPGYDFVSSLADDAIHRILAGAAISYRIDETVYPEYRLADPDLEEDPKSWGRLIWDDLVDVNVDFQEQIDSLIGRSIAGDTWGDAPF